MPIKWKGIPGYPYEVSNIGQVKRSTPSRNTRVGKILKPIIWDTGRRCYNLYRSGKSTGITAARCMALAFKGTPPTPKHEAIHIDGDCTHDFLSNIKWATHKENMDDRVKHGTLACGTKKAAAKLTDVDVRRMRKMRSQGMTHDKIATHFPFVSNIACYYAVTGATWKHVK